MHRKREKTILWIIRIVAIAISGFFLSITGVVFYHGFHRFSYDMVAAGGSLHSAVAGSAIVVGLTMFMVFPVGVATAIYIVLYAQPRLRKILDILFELLAGIPSILVGLFGFSMILSIHRLFPHIFPSLLPAAFSLGILVLPYLVKATQLGLEETDQKLISTAYGLGASREQVLMRIMLPSASPHIIKGTILAAARTLEDTAVIMLTGAVASYGIPHSVLEPFEALPFYIYATAAEYTSKAELETVFTAATILILSASMLTVFLHVWNWKEEKSP
jgi:phosphate transport system permease protein